MELFFAGIYLSIAAIGAIPWLQDKREPQELTRERLEKGLMAIIPKADDAGEITPSDPSNPLILVL